MAASVGRPEWATVSEFEDRERATHGIEFEHRGGRVIEWTSRERALEIAESRRIDPELIRVRAA